MDRCIRRRLARMLTGGALLALAAGCAINPATGRREFSLVSAEQEKQIGREGFPATIAEYGQYDDARLSAYVDSIGQRLAKVSELPDLDWHFTVLDDPVVNAFAMPGGYIYVTRGILAYLNSEAQLAGVLGHEIGHVTARHSARQITQQQLAGLGLGLASVFSSSFRRYSGAAEQALGLLMLKYGRDDETQADALGIRYATAAGWDPRQIPGTYETLGRLADKGGGRLPFYLSTHPDPGDRQQRTAQLAAEAVAGRKDLRVRAHEYLGHVRGVVFGGDPRAGYFEGARFYHPQMGFELTFPSGWTTANSHSAVAAQQPQQRAALQLTLAPNAGALSPADYVSGLARDGRVASATGARESIGGWPAWVGRVALPAQDGATPVVLDAAWVRQAPDRLFQFLGRSSVVGDADEAAILAAVRSLRPLDAGRASAVPDRVRVLSAPAAGTLRSLLPRLQPNALDVLDLAILNGVDSTTAIASGEWLKLVEPGRRR
ncbi:MAG: M48 family metalloprotease [Candidatus Eisenbacteria bacterium]|nr:M48 family metalloprotease [Candidatus Eisenbacteria bacterium]